MVAVTEIQHVRLKGELVFQDFCLKLLRKYWKDDLAELHGKSGQGQHGADITGRDNRNGFPHAAAQCKASEKDDPRRLTVNELIAEVEKAKGHKPKLDIFYVLYAGDRDEGIQSRARELSDQNESAGLFRVVAWCWDEIVKRALDFPEVAQELMVHNQVPMRPALDPRRPHDEGLRDIAASLQTALATVQAAVAEGPARTGDPVLDAKLDVFRDQLRLGNGALFIRPLRDFIRDLPSDAHPHVRFRAYANLGAAHAQADDLDSAVIAFDEAADAEPGTADSDTYRARSAFLRGDRSNAFAAAKAAREVAEDRFSAGLYVESAPPTMTARLLEDEVSAFSTEVGVAASLAQRYAGEGQVADAIRVARAIALDDWQKDGTLGQALLSQFEHDIAARIGAPLAIAQTLQIDEARVRLERAWNAAKDRGDRKGWTFYAANLCSAYRLLGEDGKADGLALEVFALDPGAPSFPQRAVLAFARRAEFDKAKDALAPLLQRSNDPEDLLLGCDIELSRGDWAEAKRLASAAFDVGTGATKARAAENLVQIEAAAGNLGEGLALADRLRPDIEPTIGFESRVAEVSRRLGDEVELAKARARLASFGPRENLGPLDRFELADAHADDGKWSEAADLLEGLHALDRPSVILKRRLFALYRADRRTDGRELYESLGPGASRSSELLRLGAAIYDRSGMVAEALRELSKAIVLDTDDIRSRLDWVRMNVRNGDDGPARRWARKAVAPSTGDPDDMMELAQVFDHFGHRRKALGLGYEALRRGWGNAEALHMAYMGLFFLHPRSEGFLHPKAVAADTVVFLIDEHGARKDYRIEVDALPSSDVLTPDHPFASRLIGKRVGDTVVLEGGIGPGGTWKIDGIKHKYVDLLHRSLEAHPTLFPDSRSLGQFHFDPDRSDSLEPMFEQSRTYANAVDNALELFRTQPIPIDAIAKMLGKDPIDASKQLRFQADIELDACMGHHGERDLAFKALEAEAPALVDALTLSLWQEIGLLTDLQRGSVRLHVVQATIDALAQRALDARGEVGRTGGSLEARGERIVYWPVSRADRQTVADANVELLEWVRANVSLVPTESYTNELMDHAKELLSDSSLDTITTGLATGALMVIEDRRLRGIAAGAGAHRMAWTQPLLGDLAARGILSLDRYVELVAELVRHRVGFIAIGAAELLRVSMLGFDAPDYQSFCDAVAMPKVDAQSMSGVLAEFVTWTWLENGKGAPRLCSEILERVLRRDDASAIFLTTDRAVRLAFQSLPFPDRMVGQLWNEYLDNFLVGHFLKAPQPATPDDD